VTDIYDYASWIGLDSSKAFQACSNNCYSGSASKSIPGSSPDYQDFQYNAKISKGVLTLTTTGRRNGVNPSVVNTWSWATVTSYSSYANLTLTYNVNTGAFSMIADHNQYVGIISNGVPSIRSMTGDGRLSGTWPLVVFSP
jgi:hypothetical protein